MRVLNLLTIITTNRFFLKPILSNLKRTNLKYYLVKNCPIRNLSTTTVHKTIINETNSSDDEFESQEIQQLYARDVLYKNTKDPLLNRIYNCSSVQELLNIFNNNKRNYNSQHLAQSIFVLADLKRIYEEITESKQKTPQEFTKKLQENKKFHEILQLIQKNLSQFSVDNLSYVLFYLNKLIPKSQLLDLIITKLENDLISTFSIGPASRFLETVSERGGLKSFFLAQRIVPLVFEEISHINLKNLDHLTTSLHKLRYFITEDILEMYKTQVGGLRDIPPKTALKVITFLNYSKWRDRNIALIRHLTLKIKPKMNYFNTNELILLYGVFFGNQEPGEVLLELQRCSSANLQKLEELSLEKLQLFSSVIYFSSLTNRNQFKKTIEKYIINCNDLESLFILRKLLCYVKISNEQLCDLYWNKIVKTMTSNDVISLIHNYMNFNIDINNYRHASFENELMKLIQVQMYEMSHFPAILSRFLCFVLVYSNDCQLLNFLVNNLEENWTQISYRDCLRLSSSLKLLNETDDKYLKNNYITRIDWFLTKILEKEMININSFTKTNILMRCCILKGNNNKIIDKLLFESKNIQELNSKQIEGLTYSLLTTSSLIPEIIDRITDYVVKYNSLLAFNIEKILYLCFTLGYKPKSPEIFFDNSINTIIRDQERLSGLALIHSALALSFFNKLPNSLIKSIFNVEFMDKLDVELANCYSKDKYPQRVRNNLMQLNRAVCLDYPEANVPWFHRKYVELPNNENHTSKIFQNRIKEHLKMIGKLNVSENVATPYGYYIDFVLDFKQENKLAIILIHQNAFTRFFVQLKGKYLMKKRHLEILGYRVVMISFSDWISLFYTDERLEFLTKLIWPNKKKQFDVFR